MTDKTGLFAAMAKAQAKLTAPSKNREVSVKMQNGGTYKFKYATLDHLIEHVRGPLTENGLWFVQMTQPGEMVTRIVHESGEFVDSAVPMPNLPNKPQEAGSVLTYFRRYSLSVALGLASDEDDDANVAEGNGYEARDRQPNGNGEQRPRNWGGRYPTATALKRAMHTHHAELERLGIEGAMDDLDDYLSSPEYQDFVKIAGEHAPYYLEGKLPDSAPPEFLQTFKLESKARDMIALRGGRGRD